MSTPIRHHYIPQFILKNFSFDGKDGIYFYDKHNEETKVMRTRDVFMGRDLYRDEKNFPFEAQKTEAKLADFENEASKIIRRFLTEDRITLTMQEDSLLRLFLALMSFRSKRVSKFFGELLPEKSKKFYSRYQSDGDYEDLWKRNIYHITTCRSIQQVIEHPDIDEPIKVFLHRDTINLFGLYFVVAERKDCDEFILGDCYPVVVTGDFMNLHLYSVYPISPDRVVLMFSRGAEGTPRNVVGFRPCVLRPPKMNDDGTYTIRVRRLYAEEIRKINSMIFKEAEEGIIYSTPITTKTTDNH